MAGSLTPREQLDAQLHKIGAMDADGGLVAISAVAVKALPYDLKQRYLALHDYAFDRGCDLKCGWLDPVYCRARNAERFKRPRPADLPTLASLHTRQLLEVLRISRGNDGFWSPEGEWGPGYSLAEIKTELARRPHVPNKTEAKAARRAHAEGASK